ncbi:hypothetical protein BpHYR1_027914 [Brachionus plicatilis]|uniref:Uncharacterized protein n=1 Tax=Brachionus plicatilis TaxID=10195 RepID=A0A3M7SBG2_BRAPC|nr:hypothetical protein BpHYR1_027914 [Brachionus plicatilis]
MSIKSSKSICLSSEGPKHLMIYQLLQFTEHVLVIQSLSFATFNILFLIFAPKFIMPRQRAREQLERFRNCEVSDE